MGSRGKKKNEERKTKRQGRSVGNSHLARLLDSPPFPIPYSLLPSMVSKVLCLGLGLLLAGSLWRLPSLAVAYSQWLSPVSADPQADMAVALGGGDRLATAMDLFRRGQVGAIYVDAIDPQVLDEALKAAGVPRGRVLWGGDASRVDTTFAEAQALAKQLQETRLPHGRLVLVSDAYHLRRSQWVVAHYLSCCFEGPEVGLKTAAVVPLTLEDHRRWWRDGGQRRWVVTESQKLVFYWLYYGLLGRRQSWNVPVESGFDWLGLTSPQDGGVLRSTEESGVGGS